jgi:hypothetical protein
MSSSESKVVMTVFQVNPSKYPPSCLRTLREECNLPLSQMNDVHVCVLVSQEHPKSLDFDVHDLRIKDVEAPPDLNLYATKQVSLVENLNHLILLPKDAAGNPLIKGMDLFDHMCRFQNMKHAATAKGSGWNDNKITQMEPSSGLGVHLYANSLKHIQPTAYDLCRGAIIKGYIGNNAAHMSTRRKMNSVGYVAGHCGVVNSEENMQRMREKLTMADSVAEISRLEAEDKELEKREKNKVHNEKAPAAAAKLEEKGCEVLKLTIKEIEALLFKVYNINMGGLKKKADYVKALEK